MTESNSEIIRRAYKDFANGNIPGVFGAFDAGIIGRSPLDPEKMLKVLLRSLPVISRAFGT
jgi:hypothetical protein